MGEKNKKLFLLDAYALIYRAYYAFIKNPRINSKGLNTSAILGFTNTLLEVIKKQKPTHLGIAFDLSGPTERDLIYTEYKANREAMPEDIRNSLSYIKSIIEAFNIPILEVPGYEADDIIGTLAKNAEEKGFTTYMMTPDKDFGQLVSDNIFMFKPARGGNEPEIIGPEEICKKYNLKDPQQFIDILGLWGDAVDNIPGVPGVGEKTAQKLISEYGSIENILENTNDLKGKLKENIEENKEQALMSKKLATIITDVPIPFDEEALRSTEPNKATLIKTFEELEFRQLASRFFNGPSNPEPTEKPKPKTPTNQQIDLFDQLDSEEKTEEDTKSINTENHNYQLCDSKEKRKKLISILNKANEVCFDTETTGLNPWKAEIVGMSFSTTPNTAFYVPISKDFERAKEVIQEFNVIWGNEEILKIGQNLKYDISVLKKYNITVQGNLFDTMIAHYVLRPDMRHNMDLLAKNYLDYTTISFDSLIEKRAGKSIPIRDVNIEKMVAYACEDADITLQLKNVFAPMLEEEKGTTLFNNMEMPLITVLAEMEYTGITLDSSHLNNLSKMLEEDIRILQGEIHLLSGASFNIDSPKQLGEILFDTLRIVEKPKKTKTGQYSTSEDVLSKLTNKHEIIPKILDYRSLRKLKSTYVDSLPNLVDPETNRVHSTFNQAVAATGRLSSDKPNLQNIPIRTERGREVRKAFVAKEEGYVLLAADYSQIELRIIADLSKDPSMIDAFSKGIDIHSATASKIFDLPLDQINRNHRNKAKAVNFGISYGQTAFGLAQNLNVSRKEAKEIIDSFFDQYKNVKTYMSNSIEFARENGYVKTLMGRKRFLRDINSSNAIVRGHAERNAINAPIQGSAADMIKIAMINIHKALNAKNLSSKMTLQVHDELIFDVPKNELEEVSELVKETMKSAIKLTVPIEVELGIGHNWLEAH